MNSRHLKRLLRDLPDVIPGVEKCIIFAEVNDRSTTTTLFKVSYQPVYTEEIIPGLPSWSSGGLDYDTLPEASWIAEEDAPLAPGVRRKGQIDLFSDWANNVLFIRIPNRVNGMKLFFFLFFAKASRSSMPVLKGGMDKPTQQVAAMLVYRMLQFLTLTNQQEIEAELGFLGRTREVMQQMNQANEALRKSLVAMGESRLDLCKQQLAKVEEELEVQFVLSTGLIQRISQYQGDFAALVEAIIQAGRYAYTLHKDLQTKSLIIEDWYVVADKPGDTLIETEHRHRPVMGGLSRTMELLDKYENAAKVLKVNQLKITSNHIGKHCPTPISAPAISDTLKSHRTRILHLLQTYPDRWTLIRSQFRPIARILEDYPRLQERESA